MKLLSAIPKFFWKTWFILNFGLGLLFLYPLFRLFLFKEAWFKWAFRLMRFWAHWILWGSGIFVKQVKGTYKNQIKGPVVFCANHTSYLDIVVSYYLFDCYFVFMGKSELKKAPLFNIFFEKMNILVERVSRVESHKAFMEADRRVKRGESVFLFPEGTIGKQVPQLKEFKNGAFRLAIENQVPILPVTFINNWKILQNGGFLKSNGKPGIAFVKIHKPISTKGLSPDNLVSLKEQVYNIIEEPLKKLNHEN